MEDIEEEEDRTKDRGARRGKRRKETDEMAPIDERSINQEIVNNRKALEAKQMSKRAKNQKI